MKCDACGSCRKTRWIDNKVYFVCYLCLRVWRVDGITEIFGEERQQLLEKLDVKVVE